MKSYKEYLNESYINLFKNREDKKREELKDELYDMLQKSYAKIGRLHGSGFSSAEDMIKDISFWKLVRRDKKIVTAVFYKDKEGRKVVATATDGSQEGKNELIKILLDDLGLSKNLLRYKKGARSYCEISGPVLSILVRELGYDLIKSVAIIGSELEKLQKEPPIYTVSPQDPEVLKHPELRDFFYMRDIGGIEHTKIMLGIGGNNLV